MASKSGIVYNLKKGFTKAISPLVLHPHQVMIEALESVNLQDFDYALDRYDRVIYMTLPTWKPLRYDCFFNKGVTLANLGEHRKAIESFTKATKIYKKKSRAWREMGISYHDLDEFDKALDCFEYGLKAKKDSSELWYLKGEILANHMNSPEIGLECYEKALELDPKNIEALSGKAQIFENKSDHKEAKKILEHALLIDPEDPENLSNKAVENIRLGNFDEALSDLDKAIQIDSTDDILWYNKACVLSLLKKEDDALDSLLVAVSLDPMNLVVMRHEDDFENIKNSQRFKNLLARDI